MGFFRIAKTFEAEYAHRLSKHPEKCRFPHGHRLRIEVVVRGEQLDANDMVCDYKALKTLVLELVRRLDHAVAINADDPHREPLERMSERVVVFQGADPTSEVVARWLSEQIARRLKSGSEIAAPSGVVYHLPEGLELERVRVWETATSWAEYVADDR
ncbi:MAG TPA: 6-carboxytetrahydropterin synthase [Acidobacteria bacterium]|nr:6-carboxytetrahydropterin synthase [Acidobacteriota bacterium]